VQRANEDQRIVTRQLLEAQATEHAWLARQLLERLGQHASALRLDTIWLRRHLQGDVHTAPVIANLLGQLAAMSQAVGRLLQPLTAPEALYPLAASRF
jgi:glucose-6-phosphate-specific signal transduction histidine kinase